MSDYEKLLEIGSDRIFKFLKNIPLHQGQFKYSPFNETCYQKMFVENSQDNIKDVEDLRSEIGDLNQTCTTCRHFFFKQRSNSVKKDDIKFGNILEDVLIDFFNEKYKLKAKRGDRENLSYPDCKLLSRDNETLAYFEVKYHAAPFLSAKKFTDRDCYEGSATLDTDKLVKQIKLVESEINPPVFYLHWIDYPCLKGLFYETSEQVKEELLTFGVEFERKDRTGDFSEKTNKKVGYTKKSYAKLLEMGSFEELVNIFLEMDKNS